MNHRVKYIGQIKVKCIFVSRFIMSNSPLRRSSMARANEGSYSFTCHHTFIHKWNEPHMHLLYFPAAERHRTSVGTYFPSC